MSVSPGRVTVEVTGSGERGSSMSSADRGFFSLLGGPLTRRGIAVVRGGRSASRQAGTLFMIIGVLGVINDLVPHTVGQGQPASLAVDVVNIAIGAICWVLPFQRWDARWTLVLAGVAFASIGWANTVTVGTGPSYGIYFIVVFAWIGVWHERWTSLRLSPVAAVAYLLPVICGVPVPPGTVASISLVIPVGVLIAETIAHTVALVRRGQDQLHHQALHDTLTGLANRALILDRAEGMLARSRRSLQPVAALFVDLDGFKAVNDALGHAAGDELLRLVAGRLSSAVRHADSVGRLGGDEFVVLVEDAVLGASPDLVAQRILDVLQHPFHLGDTRSPRVVTASIGVATGRYVDADGLLHDADFALYRAKAAGKNTFAVFHAGMLDQVAHRDRLETELRAAVETDQLFLLYQPTFAIGTRSTVTVEASLRWRHPTRGVIDPQEFFPILEETGLIVPVGRRVLTEACRTASQWNRHGLHVVMSVKVSLRQLDTGVLVQDVRHALDDSGLAPENLALELDESAFLQEPARALRCLSAAKALGVQIAIAEFGTCYSSLASLRQFPVDTVKIDQSIIEGLTVSDEARAIVHTLVHLGKALGLRTVATGIEAPEQLAALEAEGCDTGQGSLYAEPLAPFDLEQLLRARRDGREPVNPSVTRSGITQRG